MFSEIGKLRAIYHARFKAGSHCDISISISIRKWKIFHFLVLMCVCEPVVHKHKHKHKYVCSFPVSGKTRKQSPVPLYQMAAEFEEKLAEAARKYTCCTINSLPTSNLNPREFFYKMNFANPYIFLSLLFCFVVVKKAKSQFLGPPSWMIACKYTCAKCKYTCAVAIEFLCLCLCLCLCRSVNQPLGETLILLLEQ